RALMVKLADDPAFLTRMDAEGTGHTQMADQDGIAIKVDDQVLRPPSKRNDRAARQVIHEIGRERKAKIGATLLDLDDTRTFHDRLQPAPHGFDFWQFRHWRR